MSTKNTSKAVAKTTTTGFPVTKDQVPEAIERLKEQLAQLKGDQKDKISLDVSYKGTVIKNVTTVKELLEISASVKARGRAYQEEVKHFKLEGKVQAFSDSEKTVDEWDAIIAKAIFELINKVQITKIEDAIKRLSTHLDEETKLANDLADIMSGAAEAIK